MPPSAPPWDRRLSRALRTDPGKPRLTWYDNGERVELSGAVLDNWANKTANLLLDEADAGPGTRIGLDLPLHWRTVCWAVGVWRTGACVVTGPFLDHPALDTHLDVLVTNSPTGHRRVPVRIAVALPPLARAFEGPLDGAVDSAATLLAQPDTLGPVVPPAPDDPALAYRQVSLDGPPTTVTVSYATLADTGPRLMAQPPGPHRVLVGADADFSVGHHDLLDLTNLADGWSFVLVTDTHEASGDGPARDRLVATERIDVVTSRLRGDEDRPLED